MPPYWACPHVHIYPFNPRSSAFNPAATMKGNWVGLGGGKGFPGCPKHHFLSCQLAPSRAPLLLGLS